MRMIAVLGIASGLLIYTVPTCAGLAAEEVIHQQVTGDILYFNGTSCEPSCEGDASRLTGLGLNVVLTNDVAELSTANLLQYDTVVLWKVASGTIGDRRTDLEEFVASGGGLFVHSPGGVGPIDYLPSGFEVTVLSQEYCNSSGSPEIEMCIAPVSHPLIDGIAGDDLSGALIRIGPLGPSFDVLAQTCVCGEPSLATGNLVEGRIVLDAGYFSIGTLNPGSDAYIRRLFQYLAKGTTIAVEETTWGEVKSSY